MGIGERFSSPSGSGRSPPAKRYLVNFRLKISPLVATIIFPWSKKVNFVPPYVPYFCPPRDFCDAFCVTGGAFGRHCYVHMSIRFRPILHETILCVIVFYFLMLSVKSYWTCYRVLIEVGLCLLWSMNTLYQPVKAAVSAVTAVQPYRITQVI